MTEKKGKKLTAVVGKVWFFFEDGTTQVREFSFDSLHKDTFHMTERADTRGDRSVQFVGAHKHTAFEDLMNEYQMGEEIPDAD